MKFLTKEQTMTYTFTIENWETTITIETDNIETLEKVSEAVIVALDDNEEDEEIDFE
jgi:hypothetical protein